MMNMKLRFTSLIILTFILCGSFYAQTKTFSEAKAIKTESTTVYDFEKWNFSIGENKYEIDKSGKGTVLRGNNTIDNFQFSIDGAFYIDRVIYFAEYKNDLLLMGELSFSDAGGGFIVCINGKTLKTKWRTSIPAFNVAQGLIENSSAYLAGVGFISKIDLDTGKYIWKHDDLYRKYDESGAFNVFFTPQDKR